MRHDMESCDQGGEDQDEAWLDGPVKVPSLVLAN
jgi:hypothetical protein